MPFLLSGSLFVLSAPFGLTNDSELRAGQPPYRDGRPRTNLTLLAKDHGIVLRYGDGPDKCDIYGARDAWLFQADGIYYMHYDAAGPTGWLCALATSKDLIHWKKHGPVLDLGAPGTEDSRSASYGTTYFEDGKWHMFYLGTPNVSPPPDRVPSFPYLTMKAQADTPAGPWRKRYDITPFRPKPGTYYTVTTSPGQILKAPNEYLMFFSASTDSPCKRTLGIARTKNLNGSWRIDPAPIVPLEEQIENASLYYERTSDTWFLFTNHVGINELGEYTDAVWVYWSSDLNRWDPDHKAVVLDKRNCTWSQECIGLPSVLPVADRLAILYDAPGGHSTSHMRRSIGLAWLKLPLKPPSKK